MKGMRGVAQIVKKIRNRVKVQLRRNGAINTLFLLLAKPVAYTRRRRDFHICSIKNLRENTKT